LWWGVRGFCVAYTLVDLLLWALQLNGIAVKPNVFGHVVIGVAGFLNGWFKLIFIRPRRLSAQERRLRARKRRRRHCSLER
jgi:hypothetical protein